MKKLATIALVFTLALAGCSAPNVPSSVAEVSSSEEEYFPDIKVPSTYENVPKEYFTLLDDWYRYVSISRSYDGSQDVPIEDYLEVISFTEHMASFHTAVDINSDGIIELIFGNDDTLSSIWTLENGKPVFVEVFWSRSTGQLLDDGTIYNVGSGGASCTELNSYVLKKGATKLTTVEKYHGDYIGISEMFTVETLDEKDADMTSEQFLDLCELYRNPPNPMKLEWNAIL